MHSLPSLPPYIGASRLPRRSAALAGALSVAALVGVTAPAPAQSLAHCASPATRMVAQATAGIAAIGGNVALYTYFENAWWAGERAEHFWVNHDWGMDFRDQDKLGHVVGGYHLARLGTDMLRAGCVSGDRAALWGALYAAAFQLQIEIWDGFYDAYGFSPPDLLANSAGTLLAVAHEQHPALRALKPTISYDPTAAYDARRTHGDFPRATIDYSGQTYWISADIDALLPDDLKPLWPALLRVSLGHSITDWVDAESGRAQRAQRRFLLSIDLDPEKLPGNHPLWRRIKRELSYYRFPAPALQLWPVAKGIGWYR